MKKHTSKVETLNSFFKWGWRIKAKVKKKEQNSVLTMNNSKIVFKDKINSSSSVSYLRLLGAFSNYK